LKHGFGLKLAGGISMKARNVFLLLLISLAPIGALAQSANDDLIAAAKKGDIEAVKSLIAKGANVNARTNYGATALHFAADRGHLEVIKALVEAGADVNARDDFYKMPPMALATMRDHKEVVAYLQQAASAKKEPLQPPAAQTNVQPEKKSPKPVVEVEEAALRKYAGEYRIDEDRQFTFIVKDGKLGGWDVRQYSFPLTAIDKNVFRIGDDDSRTFTFNEENGKIISVTLAQSGFKQTYNRVEGK
jgi:Ankyrin repeats (3 copies)